MKKHQVAAAAKETPKEVVKDAAKEIKKVVTQQVIFKKYAKTDNGYVAHGGIGDATTLKEGTYKIGGDLSGTGEVLQNGINVTMTFNEPVILHQFYTLTFL